MGFTSNILIFVQSFLSNRYQSVTINHQTSDQLHILAGAINGQTSDQFQLSFNLHISKLTQEVVFSRKTNKLNHMFLTFNAIPVSQPVASL